MATFLSESARKYDSAEKNDIDEKINNLGDDSATRVSYDNALNYIDGKDIGVEAVKGLYKVYSMWKGGFGNSGFDVKQVGDYVIVYGKNKTWTNLKDTAVEKIAGRRYKVGSAMDVKLGVSSFASNVSRAERFSRSLKSNFSNFGKDTFTGVSAVAGYAKIAFDTIGGVTENIHNGASVSKIAADATTDVLNGLAKMAVESACAKIGAAIGTIFPVPVVGTLVGSVIGGILGGFIYDFIIDGGIKIGGKSVAEWVSTGLEKVYDKIGEAISGSSALAKKLSRFLPGKRLVAIMEAVRNVLTDVANTIGDAVVGSSSNSKALA